jgi:beta-galactosidase GanA
MQNPSPTSQLHFGAAYYPEYWPEECWPQNLDLMKQAHINVAHILKMANRDGIETPAGVEIRPRVRQDGPEIYFLINHERRSHSVRLLWKAHDHLGEQDLEEEFTLAPYSICVPTKAKPSVLAGDRPKAGEFDQHKD